MKAFAGLVLLPMILAAQSHGDSCGTHKIGTNTPTNVTQPSPANAGHTMSERMDESSKSMQRVAPGTWGGTHIRMEVRDDGADIEYDCARGTIDVPLNIDTSGRFAAEGTYVRQGPGPIRMGKIPPSQPARYTGSIGEKEMTLRVILTEGSKEIGTFTLSQGNEGFVVKCR